VREKLRREFRKKIEDKMGEIKQIEEEEVQKKSE